LYVMILPEEVQAGQLADLLKQVQAGNEVLLTQDNKTVAKLVLAGSVPTTPPAKFQARSFRGHEVLTPVISQSEIADEMFGQNDRPGL
jgi:antitoxin (DNA-binding transcriptional repressor) of toxin-antitoxin stability system